MENRGWPINYRGDILIHAAKKCTKKEYEIASVLFQSMGVSIPELKSLCRGQVIGIVTIVDCKFSQIASGWGMPLQYHWKLARLHQFLTLGGWGFLKSRMIWSWRWLHD
ncbi:MAG: hypothetical protein V7K22_06475 [Nostoc sp.]